VSKEAASREVVLVTGFPRLVARLVVDELLTRSPTRRVRLLAREKFMADAETFVRRSVDSSRVELIEGDAASIDLGLSGREFRRLAAETTHIQHHANISYEGIDAKTIRALNEQGAREMLELARNAPKLRRLVHQSAAMVSGDRTGVVREDELDRGQSFRTPVEESKYRAERLMLRAANALPVTVVRPSLIVGHSKTGEIDRLDGPYLLIMLLLTSPVEITLPMPTRGDAPLHMVPVDYVARASVALMDDPRAVGRAFHLVDPAPMSARHVYELVARIAGRRIPRGFIPINLTRAVLRAPGVDRIAKSPRAFLDHLATDVAYDASGTREILGPLGIECPPFEQYAETLVAHVRERLAARRAQRAAGLGAEIEDPLA